MPARFMWDLYWDKWHQDIFFSPYDFGFPPVIVTQPVFYNHISFICFRRRMA